MHQLFKTGRVSFISNLMKKGPTSLIIQLIIIIFVSTFLPGFAGPGECNETSMLTGVLYINEFMADNDNTIEDPDDPNNFEDWIEIYNPGDSIVDMGGMYLTDDTNDPTQWQVPAGVTIPAGGYLLFWADNDEEQGNTHTNFRLAADGEDICLFDTDGVTCIDSITFDMQLTDVSYGRYPDGVAGWGFMTATPGAANTPLNTPPAISGTTRAPVSPSENDSVWVTCTVTDDGTLVSVILTYDTGSGAVHVTMHDDGSHNDGNKNDGLYGANIPAFAQDTVVDYYITATDDLGTESIDPSSAPTMPYYYFVGYVPPLLYINEFMADNDNTIEDPDDPNNFEDWIEIYNPGDSIVDMGGMYLTDDPNDPTQWQVPAGVTIPAGGYLLFWADNDEEQGNTHTNFRLAAGGEDICLFGMDGVTIIDSIMFDVQLTDVSYGRYPDGATGWDFMTATPGASNGTHNAPPAILGTTHTPFSPSESDSVWVTCTVTDDGTLLSVILTYDAGSGVVHVTMHDDGSHNDGNSNDGLYGAKIPAFAQDTIVDYYITATDDLGAESIDPSSAPTMSYYYFVDYVPPLLYINEFMADNDNTIEDPDDPNNFEDWIEIYNADGVTIDLGGLYLTDDLTNPTKWRVPEGITIPAGGYLLLWADGDEDQGNTHTCFNLNRDGEEIGLFDTDAKRNMTIDTVIFGEQSTDVSYGRSSDGGELWMFYENSTPGYSNYSIITIDIELNTGWSMISLPVRPYNSNVSELFPGAVVVYGFESGRGYVRVAENENLEVGKGYWILLNDAQIYTLTGQSIIEYTHPVYGNGWEMIGGCTSPAKALVSNCSIEVIYGFVSGLGYKRIPESENLDPGKGYWILLSNTIEQAELTIDSAKSNN